MNPDIFFLILIGTIVVCYTAVKIARILAGR